MKKEIMMKKVLLLIIIFTYGTLTYGATPNNLSDKIKDWKEDCYKQLNKNRYSSKVDYYTGKFYNIISEGPIIAAPLMTEFQNGNGEVIVFFPKIFKIVFNSSFDSKEKKWLFDDYPKYVYYPSGFHPDKKNSYESIWVYWWKEGRKFTPVLFQKKYDLYVKAQKEKNKEATKKYFKEVKNLGIVAFPQLLAKIQSGDKSLIPIFSYWSNDKVSSTANIEDCVKWWEQNKKDYKAVLNY